MHYVCAVPGLGAVMNTIRHYLAGLNHSTMSEKTIGEQRVRTDFNAAQGSPRLSVADIKAKTAELINICDDLKGADPRAADIAQMRFEEAAMWAVKAATA